MFFFDKTPIFDYDACRMCPSDLVKCDNRGAKRVRLGQTVLNKPVSNKYNRCNVQPEDPLVATSKVIVNFELQFIRVNHDVKKFVRF